MARLTICDNCRGTEPDEHTGWLAVTLSTKKRFEGWDSLPYLRDDYCSLACLIEDIEAAKEVIEGKET